jgi:preprotein translocase subunit SecA
MRLFGSERIAALMDRMGAQEGEVLTHPLITRSIESAQKRVELQNFQSRKRLLEYDDVMNQQREVIYSLRSFALEGGEELKSEALKMVEKAVARRVETVLAATAVGDDDAALEFGVLQQELLMHYLLQVPVLAARATCRRRRPRRPRRHRGGPRGVRGQDRELRAVRARGSATTCSRR